MRFALGKTSDECEASEGTAFAKAKGVTERGNVVRGDTGSVFKKSLIEFRPVLPPGSHGSFFLFCIHENTGLFGYSPAFSEG